MMANNTNKTMDKKKHSNVHIFDLINKIYIKINGSIDTEDETINGILFIVITFRFNVMGFIAIFFSSYV